VAASTLPATLPGKPPIGTICPFIGALSVEIGTISRLFDRISSFLYLISKQPILVTYRWGMLLAQQKTT